MCVCVFMCQQDNERGGRVCVWVWVARRGEGPVDRGLGWRVLKWHPQRGRRRRRCGQRRRVDWSLHWAPGQRWQRCQSGGATNPTFPAGSVSQRRGCGEGHPIPGVLLACPSSGLEEMAWGFDETWRSTGTLRDAGWGPWGGTLPYQGHYLLQQSQQLYEGPVLAAVADHEMS